MKYKITIVNFSNGNNTYERESQYENFYDALENDLYDIMKMIMSDDCMEYEWEKIE